MNAPVQGQCSSHGPRRAVPATCAWALLAGTCLGLPGVAEASIRVELTGVDAGPVRDNVMTFLSLNRYATLDDLSPDVVERLFYRAEGEVANALRPFGYYDSKLESSLTADGKNWIAHLAVTPGPRVMVTAASVSIEGPGAEQPFLKELVDKSPLRAGEPLDHGAYENLKSELQQRATSSGYLDARFTTSELSVDPRQLSATETLVLDTGPRYKFGEIEIDQDAIKPALVKRYLRFHKGDWYDAAALLRTQFALDDTQFFRIVEVLPGDRNPQTLTVPVHIDARRTTNRNKYTIGVGYQTDYGLRLKFVWNQRLTNESGHRFRFETNISQNNQDMTATYVVPYGDPALEKAQLDLTASDELLGDSRVRSLTLRPSVTQVLGRYQRVLFADVTRTESVTAGQASTATLVVPGISFTPVPPAFTADSAVLSFAPGWFAQLIGSGAFLGSSANFVQLHVRDQWRWRLSPGWYLLARAEFGTTFVKNFDEVPTQYRFFAGGDRSVRGFAFNSLSPTEVVPGTNPPEEARTGGKHLAVASVEFEKELPKHLAAAIFSDVGNAFNHFGDPMEYSVGVGIRYKLPFVSIGLDLAQPLSRSGSPRLHINVSPVS